MVHDGEFNLTATEDLGGGYKAIVKGGLKIRGRSGNGAASDIDRDGTITLVTPMGAFYGGSVRTCGPWEQMMSGVVTGPIRSANESNTATPLPKCSLIDVVGYTAPMGPVTVGVSYGEFGTGATNGSAAPNGVTSTTGTGLTYTNLSGVYTAGPLLAGVDATFYAQSNTGTTSAGKEVLDGLVRTRLWGTYDFGVAKLGLGYLYLDRNLAATTLASLSIPMGAVTFGLEYAARDAQGALCTAATASCIGAKAIGTAVFGSTDGDKASNSVGVGATYSFSKMTTLNTSYVVYSDAGANSKLAGAAGLKKLDDEYRIRLMKTF
jgi:hypothetical protein